VYRSELITMTEAGAGLIVGTVGPDGEPRATRAWSLAAVDDVPGRVRVAVTADDDVTLRNLRGGLVAVTAANVRDLRSVQVKGRVISVSAPTEADRRVAEDQTERFLHGVHETDGNPLEALRRMLPHSMVMVEIDVSDAFDQTPGPVAGSELGVVPA
jgi:hypothetical protein